jgi:Lrp/AsnC family leucine-responsive transcriptional regulator
MQDAVDQQILRALMEDGRITWRELAAQIGLSPPSTAERVRKLEEAGVINRYVALVDPRSLGCTLLAFVSLSVTDPDHHDQVMQWVAEAPEIQECHIVAGEHDYLLKVRCRDSAHLERFLREEVGSLPGVSRTMTTVALLTTKETTAVPFRQAAEDVDV